LEAGVELMANFYFVVRCHWLHVAMSGTGWSRDNRKMAAYDWWDCGCGRGAFERERSDV